MARSLSPEEATTMIIRRRLQQIEERKNSRRGKETEKQARRVPASQTSRSGR
ncbi:hypothetical protein [Pelomicrobium sp.]|jgi:hypothetical protein|uniref:hypothetical protein n=1 Tax=Pelomicrobium sp. TaxID=2815319 RepID=UPI002FDE2662